MRSFVHRSIIVGSCLAMGVIGAGCEGKQATEYVTGISTQVTVPRDLKAVRVEVSVGGVPQFCRGYRVYDGKVQLPRSLGTFAQSDGAIVSGPITYTIAGLMTDDVENPFFAACTQARVKSDDVRILRRSRQPYIRDEILFLPMPLKYSCYDKQCDDENGVEMTCKGGKCVPATLTDAELARLPKYTPDLVDGTGATCFSVKQCMAPPLPAIAVDASNCTYAVPGTPSAPVSVPGLPPIEFPVTGDGVNVQITYDGGFVQEILDSDLQEGFFRPDPEKPQVFRLAEGLCEMVKGKDAQGKPTAHRITAVRANGRCQPKQPTQPLCHDDQLAAMGLSPDGTIPTPAPAPVCSVAELKPPPTALVVVVDNTAGHTKFFEALKKNTIDPNDEDSAVGPVIRGLLADPIFQSTDLGLVYASGPAACGDPDQGFGLGPTETQREPILASLDASGAKLNAGEPSYSRALPRAYELITSATKPYFRKAVIVLGNSTFITETCGGAKPEDLAKAAHDGQAISTYVMQLTKAGPDLVTEGKQPAADALAIAGGTGVSAYKTAEARTKFSEVVNSLATCVYETDTTSAPIQGDFVSFTDPVTPGATAVRAEFNAECTTEGAGKQGWATAPSTTSGKTNVFLCKETCDAYRGILNTAAVFAATTGQPAIPVPLYAYKTACVQQQQESGDEEP